jgi:hypothetical protein
MKIKPFPRNNSHELGYCELSINSFWIKASVVVLILCEQHGIYENKMGF